MSEFIRSHFKRNEVGGGRVEVKGMKHAVCTKWNELRVNGTVTQIKYAGMGGIILITLYLHIKTLILYCSCYRIHMKTSGETTKPIKHHPRRCEQRQLAHHYTYVY